METNNTIEILPSTPNGPVVEYGADDDAATVEAAIPAGWSVSWETPAYKIVNGRFRSPLISATPLGDALTAAVEAAKVAEQAWMDDDSCDAGDREHPSWLATAAADDAVLVARSALAASDEPREWRLMEDGTDYETITASNVAAALEIACDNVSAGDYGDLESTLWVDVDVRCDATGETDGTTVALHPSAPSCADDHEHDWCSPHSVVGGLKENPGVFSSGGCGASVSEVCSHCGAYRVTDSGAQRPDTGEQGLTEVSYSEPDEASLAWVATQ